MKKGKVLTNPLIRSVLRHPYPQKEERALTRDGAVLFAEEDGTIYGTSQSTLIYGGDYAEALCRVGRKKEASGSPYPGCDP